MTPEAQQSAKEQIQAIRDELAKIEADVDAGHASFTTDVIEELTVVKQAEALVVFLAENAG